MKKAYDMAIVFTAREPVDLCPVNDGARGRCKHRADHPNNVPHELVDLNDLEIEEETEEVLATVRVSHHSESFASAITALLNHPDLDSRLGQVMSMAGISEEAPRGPAVD